MHRSFLILSLLLLATQISPISSFGSQVDDNVGGLNKEVCLNDNVLSELEYRVSSAVNDEGLKWDDDDTVSGSSSGDDSGDMVTHHEVEKDKQKQSAYRKFLSKRIQSNSKIQTSPINTTDTSSSSSQSSSPRPPSPSFPYLPHSCHSKTEKQSSALDANKTDEIGVCPSVEGDGDYWVNTCENERLLRPLSVRNNPISSTSSNNNNNNNKSTSTYPTDASSSWNPHLSLSNQTLNGKPSVIKEKNGNSSSVSNGEDEERISLLGDRSEEFCNCDCEGYEDAANFPTSSINLNPIPDPSPGLRPSSIDYLYVIMHRQHPSCEPHLGTSEIVRINSQTLRVDVNFTQPMETFNQFSIADDGFYIYESQMSTIWKLDMHLILQWHPKKRPLKFTKFLDQSDLINSPIHPSRFDAIPRDILEGLLLDIQSRLLMKEGEDAEQFEIAPSENQTFGDEPQMDFHLSEDVVENKSEETHPKRTESTGKVFKYMKMANGLLKVDRVNQKPKEEKEEENESTMANRTPREQMDELLQEKLKVDVEEANGVFVMPVVLPMEHQYPDSRNVCGSGIPNVDVKNEVATYERAIRVEQTATTLAITTVIFALIIKAKYSFKHLSSTKRRQKGQV